MKWDKKPIDSRAKDGEQEEDGEDEDGDEGANTVLDCKVVVVGDSSCGKTCLIQRLVHNNVPQHYVPTGFEKYDHNMEISASSKFCLSIWDTSGSTTYDTVRPLAYKDADVSLLCFNISDWDSLQNVLIKWYPEVRQQCPATPVILCGCKRDQRVEEMPSICSLPTKIKRRPVFAEQALEVCRQIQAVTYVETCSREDSKSAREAFAICALASRGRLNSNLTNNLKKSTSCSTISKCKSMLKLRKCKSRADFKQPEFAQMRKNDTKKCTLM